MNKTARLYQTDISSYRGMKLLNGLIYSRNHSLAWEDGNSKDQNRGILQCILYVRLLSCVRGMGALYVESAITLSCMQATDSEGFEAGSNTSYVGFRIAVLNHLSNKTGNR